MLICKDCGAIFEIPEYMSIERYDENTNDYDAESWFACPACGGTAYNETYICCECGNYVFGEFVELKNGEVYCSDCFNVYNIRD